MNSLNKIQTLVFQIGGLLMIVGAVLPIVPATRPHAALVFTVGALSFGSMQLLQRYDGRNFVIRRLRGQQILGAFLLMISAALMIMQRYGTGPFPIRGDEWKITLAVAAILEVYTAFRLPQELDREARKQ